MSTNLDRSLDEILSANPKRSAGRGRPRRGGGRVGKSTRVPSARAAVVPVVLAAAPAPGKGRLGDESKIVVSGLPTDVTENQIKELFAAQIGPVKRCTLSYGPNGQSKGSATVIFANKGHASTAYTKYNDKLIDGSRRLKIEIIVNPSLAGIVEPTLASRIAKTQGKNAVAAPAAIVAAAAVATGGRRGGGRRRGPRSGGAGGGEGGVGARVKKPKKTAEELDAEMSDYFSAPPATAA